MLNSDWEDDAAFTQDELNAGMQHTMRAGRADGSRPQYVSKELEGAVQGKPALAESPVGVTRFATYAEAQAWAKADPSSAFSRKAGGHGFESKWTSGI